MQADARLTMAELGRRVHLSQPAVTERVRKLEAAGVITGYRATVDLAQARLRHPRDDAVGRAEYARVVKLVQQTPECINAYNVTGEDSWVLEIAVIDVAHLDAVVTQVLHPHRNRHLDHPEPGARAPADAAAATRGRQAADQESDQRMTQADHDPICYATCDLCDLHKSDCQRQLPRAAAGVPRLRQAHALRGRA